MRRRTTARQARRAQRTFQRRAFLEALEPREMLTYQAWISQDPADTALAESVGEARTFKVHTNAPNNTWVDVRLSVSGDAAYGSDYVTSPVPAAGGITVRVRGNGTGNGWANVTIDSHPDAFPEGDEGVNFAIDYAASNLSYPGNPYASGISFTIEDDDLTPNTPYVSVQPAGDGAEDGPVNGKFTFYRSVTTNLPLAVNFALGGGATVGLDYLLKVGGVSVANGPIEIPANESSVDVDVEVLSDSVLEPGGEALILAVANSANYAILGGPATIQIADDSRPRVNVANAAAVTEGGSLQYTLALTGQTSTPVIVSYATAPGSASTADYTHTTGSATLGGGGQLSAVISAPTVNDLADEDDETVQLLITGLSGDNGVVLGDAAGLGTIVDNDATPTVSINSPSVWEDQTRATFTITLSNPSGRNVTVAYATNSTNSTATANTDYTPQTGTATILAGATTAVVEVPLVWDDLAEPNETFNLKLTAASGAVFPGNAASLTGVGTILDKPQPPTIALASTHTFAEGGTNNRYSFQLSRTPTDPITVTLQFVSGTATLGADFSSTASFTIPAGSATTYTRLATIIDDGNKEPSENYQVSIASATNARIVAPSSSTVTIADNDRYKVKVEKVQDAEEKVRPGVLRFTRDVALGPLTVPFQLVAGQTPAAVAADFTGLPTTVSFAATELERIVELPVAEDGVQEGTEFATLAITAPGPNAAYTTTSAFGPASTVLSIVDGDVPDLVFGATERSCSWTTRCRTLACRRLRCSSHARLHAIKPGRRCKRWR